MEFKKIVRYVGGKSGMLQYALSTGEDTFMAGVDYVITNRKDFSRLIKSGLFEDVTPVPAPVVPVKEEEVVIALVEDVPPTKRKKRDEEEVSN
jgi:hypothetical protein